MKDNVLNYGFEEAKNDLPIRLKDSNKTDGGKTLVLAGSKNMWGAAILASLAAHRVGAGYIFLLADASFPSYKHPEFLTVESIDEESLEEFSAIALGPGFKDSEKTCKYLNLFLNKNKEAVVLDAEALNVLAQNKIFPLSSEWILTPHEGEMGRLLNKDSSEVKCSREESCLEAHDKYKATVLLKGHETIVKSQEAFYKINSGNPSLSKAGTGDILTGLITGLRSQGLSSLKAACLGAFVHGYCADLWLEDENDILSLTASDILDILPHALYKIRN